MPTTQTNKIAYNKMRLNSAIKLVGIQVVLVPYEQHHVPKYHEWMKSEELRFLTGSEPLSLEEEYEMQKSWREDEDKCTFIILDKLKYESSSEEISSMVGDTNIFLKTEDDILIGEIEIMIAEVEARGKKLGWESTIMMLLYGIEQVGISRYVAKISTKNEISLRMFQKMEFTETSRNSIFDEITMTKEIDPEWIEKLRSHCIYKIEPYG